MNGAVCALFVIIPAVAHAADGSLPEYSFLSSFLQMIAALAVVVGLIFITWHFSGKLMKGIPLGQRFGSRHIRVVDTYHLAPKRSLMLVEVSGAYLLLSNTEQGIALLGKVDMLEEIEVVGEEEQLAGFAGVLARLRKAT